MIVGVDTGGTFTDFVLVDEKGKWRILKVLSTPKNPAEAVVRGMRRVASGDYRIIHGSTVATNTILERKGARCALVTNRGFEDILEIQRQNRERIYDLCYRKPRPLLERELRFGIRGRVNSKGEVVEELDEKELEELALRLKKLGVEAVAVSLLFCFLHRGHEDAVKGVLENHGLLTFTSSEILPVFREYERTSTVVINAYVAPKMKSYLESLSSALGEDRIRVMQSNGGSILISQAAKEPVRTVLSGPAGGVVAAAHLGKAAGFENLITLDMGGTSTDVSLIHRARLQTTTEYKISGLPIGVPVIEIHTIGAGGGSIARIDEGGALRVGPESAGADPGPICYGRGTQVTVTDANMFLGRLIPEGFLGGSMRVYPERIEPHMRELAQKAGMTPHEMAEGIITVANSNMEAAIRTVSVEKGHDPRDYTLFAFGGAAGLHAVELAKNMRIPRVVIPRFPGALSAIGMLLSDVVKDYSLTVMKTEPSPGELEEAFRELEELAARDMEEEGHESFLVERTLFCRWRGQSYEVEVPFCDNYRRAFEERYAALYGTTLNREIEVVNIQLKAVAKTEKPEFERIPCGGERPPDAAFMGTRRLFSRGRILEAGVYKREALLAGNRMEGPAVITEYSSTTYLPEGAELQVDPFGNLLISLNFTQ